MAITAGSKPNHASNSERNHASHNRKGNKRQEVTDAETRMKRLKSKMMDQMNGLMTAEEKKQFIEAQKQQLMAGGITAAPQR